MNMYSVVPNPEMTGWLVKLEDVAPEQQYGSKDEALDEAKRLAKENTPSVVKVLDQDHNVTDELTF
ncbi:MULTISPECIES: DUF2188 domain-containing protein [Sporosarcina]|uniref:DUF2188 domain-containing protein n=1 Tax=Sporosarcina TaxID=1569 RepID=UPI0005909F58|nr:MULTISPECIES: DUF2188 domain-containing protein [Sporosarcina]WJY26261.1 DUF2188 domain-containing protein [Sporosarcina sp. 0.2-SM1T-5]